MKSYFVKLTKHNRRFYPLLRKFVYCLNECDDLNPRDIAYQTLRAVLDSQSGLEVVGEAVDGMEAVDLTHQVHPDAIVMDMFMARMNGIE